MRIALLFTALAASSLCACANGQATPFDDDAGASLDAATASDAGRDAEAASSSTTVAQACQENATRYCQQLEQCFPFAIRQTWGDVATCTATVAPACVDILQTPGDGWTPDNLMACVRARAALTCKTFLLRKPELAECATTGAVADGAACRWSAQCKSGYCKITTGVCGNCVTPTARGGACASYPDCAGDLLCAKNDTCQSPVDLNGMCDDTKPCSLGTACIGGTCKAPGAEGAACAPMLGSIDCDYYQQLYCNGTSSKCTKYVIAKAGESCAVPNQSIVCEAGAGCANGTCTTAGTAGTLCNPSTGITCAYPLTCDMGTCHVVEASQCH